MKGDSKSSTNTIEMAKVTEVTPTKEYICKIGYEILSLAFV